MAGAAGGGGLELLTLRDGRVLAFRVYGAPLDDRTETAILYMHGVPSCHMEAEALSKDAARLGLPIVAMDRPGCGRSDFKSSRTLQSTADDAWQLVQHLRLKRLLLMGTSGGGPYAAAFASLYPDQVEALVLISAVAPTDWDHLPLLGAMRGADLLQFSLVRLPPMGGLWALHWVMAYMAKNHTQTLLEHAPEGMAAADGEVLRNDERVREAFGRCLQHAYSRGSRGMAQDVRVLGGRWGINLATIKCWTLIWQGEEDKSVPVSHAQWWSNQIPHAKLTVLPGEGHVTVLLHHAGSILDAALHWRPQHGGPAEQQQAADRAAAGGAATGGAQPAAAATAAVAAAADQPGGQQQTQAAQPSAHKGQQQEQRLNRVSATKLGSAHAGGHSST